MAGEPVVENQYGYDLNKLIELRDIVQAYTSYEFMDNYDQSICHRIKATENVYSATDEVWIGQSYEKFKELFEQTATKFCKQVEAYGVSCNSQLFSYYGQLQEKAKSMIPSE